MQNTKSNVIEYYEKSLPDYFLIFFRKDNYAMNFGYWDHTVRNRGEALHRIYEKAQEYVRSKPTDLVLDAGCGLGEGSFWFAQHVGCKTVGIAVNSSQISKAKEFANTRGFPNSSFEVMDYTRMSFKPNTFDMVFAIETICHIEDKADFYKEVMRVLKPGGRLFVAEYDLKNTLKNTKDKHDLQIVLDGWAMSIFWTTEQHVNALKHLGFSNIQTEDYSDKTVRTSLFLYLYSLPGVPLYSLLHTLGLIDDVRMKDALACRYQWLTKQRKLWGHMIISAVKK